MKASLKRIVVATVSSVLLILLGGVGFLGWCTAVRSGDPTPSANKNVDLRAETLEKYVRALPAPRAETSPEKYKQAEDYIRSKLKSFGYQVHEETVPGLNLPAQNLWVELPGKSDQHVIFGAHYDTASTTPGADDNASGTAVALELAKAKFGSSFKHPVTIVLFANEEPPHFRSERMGSHVMAKRLHEKNEKVCVMVSLEMLGYFDDTPGSQKYPPILNLFYPDTGDFIAVVTNLGGRKIANHATESFQSNSHVPAFGFAGPEWISGIDFSDHMPFWNHDFPAMMLTDTSFFRNDNYHTVGDLPDTLDYVRMAETSYGVEAMLDKFANSDCDY